MAKGKMNGSPWHIEYHYEANIKRPTKRKYCKYVGIYNFCSNQDFYMCGYKCQSPKSCIGNPKNKNKMCDNQVEEISEEILLQPIDTGNKKGTYFLLLRTNDNIHIELCTQGLTEEKMPQLHKKCLNANVGDSVSFLKSTYKILKKQDEIYLPYLYREVKL